MRILHISIQDGEGGAFKSAYRLHESLRAAGHDSRMLVLCKTTNDPQITAMFRPKLGGKIAWRLLSIANQHQIKKYHKMPLYGWTGSNISIGALRVIKRIQPDIVHLHLFDGVLAYREIARLPYPLFWTLHDMSAITGGCAFTTDCTRFTGQCGQCPDLGSTDADDFSAFGWQQKHTAWQHPHLTAITPSKWLQQKVQASSMAAQRTVIQVPYGIPLSVFTPAQRPAARARWEFTPEKFYLLAGAISINDPRKGFPFVIKAAQWLAQRHGARFELVTFGRGRPEVPGVTVRHLGYIHSDDELAQLYAAADAFVLPSLIDNFPNMLLESLACGTPAVTFNTGGCPEIIKDGQTGFVVSEHEGVALGRTIERLMIMPEHSLRDLRAQCSAVARERYSFERAAQVHHDLYRAALTRGI